MAERLDELESRIERLADELQHVKERVEELEAERRFERADTAEPGEARPELGPAPEAAASNGALSHVAAVSGRTFLILGGAYLLRALTDAGVLPRELGAALAFGYAAIWLFLAWRAAAARPELDRAAYGLSFALIAFPLLVELTTRFELLSPLAGTVVLGLATALGAAVAWHRRVASLAWVLLLGAAAASLFLLQRTHAVVPLAVLAVLVGIGFDRAAADRRWRGVRVASAALADFVVLALGALALTRPEFRPETVLVELGAFLLYFGSYLTAALVRQRFLDVFERVQASVVLVIGYLGAMLLAGLGAPALALVLGIASVALGVASYALAYLAFAKRRTRRVDAWFYTSYALVGVLAGLSCLLSEPAYAWMLLCLVLAALGTRDETASLPLHAAIAACFAATASGLATAVAYAFGGAATSVWPPLALSALVALAVSAVVYLAPLRSEVTSSLLPARLGKILALGVLVAGLGALSMFALGGSIAGVSTDTADPGRLAALRSAVLALAALALALVSRTRRFGDARLLVYPVLAAGGLKLLFEDFPHGRPLTLFAAFAFYGIALLFAPRLRAVQ